MDMYPTVLHPIELAAFMQYAMNKIRSPLHLIICSNQEEFLAQLFASIHHEKEVKRQEAEDAGFEPHSVERLASRPHELLVPTLHILANSSDVKVTFCATLNKLQAYLSVHHLSQHDLAKDDSNTARPTIALVNVIALHRNTSSFSAQGLSRTFATAVEAAARTKAKLLIVECPNRAPASANAAGRDSDEAMHEIGDDELSARRVGAYEDPWEEQVAILNVTTKSFGAGESGWVGRTVKIRRVVERWFVFGRPKP
jgi:hypothetical protein